MLGGLEADWGLVESRLLMRSGSTTWFVPSGLPEEEVVVVVGLVLLELFRNSSPSGWMARLSPGFMMQARATALEVRGELQVTGCRSLGGKRCRNAPQPLESGWPEVPITELETPIGVMDVGFGQ